MKTKIGTKVVIPDQTSAWYSRSELKSVYRELYYGNLEEKKHALGRIQIWRVRSFQKLPVSMESTSVLVNAYVCHQEALRAGTVHEQDEVLRYNYSMGLIRFINYITEDKQNQKYAQPLHILAGELGVPEWIVDLRHSATHDLLPALSVLTVGVKWVLDWLQTKYWLKQIKRLGEEEMEIQVPDGEQEEKVNQLKDAIMNYQQLKFNGLAGVGDAETRTALKKSVMLTLQTLIPEYRSETLELLSADGYLTPTEEQLKALKMNAGNILNNPNFSIPLKLVHFWKPMLILLHTYQLTPLLLRQLVASVTSECNLRNKLLTSWIYDIIKELDNADEPQNRRKNEVLYKTSCVIQFHSLLETLTACPSKFTLPLAQLLSTKLPLLDSVKQEKLLALMKMYTGTEYEKEAPKSQQIKTISDLNFEQTEHNHNSNCIDGPENQLQNQDIFPFVNNTDWSLCQDCVDWSKCPLGAIPNQKIAYRKLEVGHDDLVDDSRSSSDSEDMEDFNTSEEDLKWTSDQMREIKQNIAVF